MFYECTNLDIVICEATTPPTLGSYVFGSDGSSDIPNIYTPNSIEQQTIGVLMQTKSIVNTL